MTLRSMVQKPLKQKAKVYRRYNQVPNLSLSMRSASETIAKKVKQAIEAN